MNKEIDESLSAVVDGELDVSFHGRITDELIDNANARESWHRYHLVRDALKKNLPDEIATGLVDRVCNAIAEEPAHIAECDSEPRSGSKKKSLFGFGFQPAYGFVAAAALVVAVVTVTQIERSVIDTGTDIASLAQSDVPLGEPMVAQPEAVEQTLAAGTSALPVDNLHLSTYLANHATRSRSYPMHDGLLPYVRSVEFQRGR